MNLNIELSEKLEGFDLTQSQIDEIKEHALSLSIHMGCTIDEAIDRICKAILGFCEFRNRVK